MSEFYLLRLGGVFLKDSGENLMFTKFVKQAKKFETEVAALDFAFGDRPKRGDTEVVRVKNGSLSFLGKTRQTAALSFHVGQEPTSLLENSGLWKKHIKETNIC